MSKQVQDAYIVAATRTPIGRSGRGYFRNPRPDDLLIATIRESASASSGLKRIGARKAIVERNFDDGLAHRAQFRHPGQGHRDETPFLQRTGLPHRGRQRTLQRTHAQPGHAGRREFRHGQRAGAGHDQVEGFATGGVATEVFGATFDDLDAGEAEARRARRRSRGSSRRARRTH